MIEKINKLKKSGKRIGFTASTAELAHPGFIDMLLQAKKDCDFLIFGLLTDPTISRPNSKNKPVETTFERWVRLSAIRYIDMIIPFDTEEDLVNMINLIQPSVRFVGEEYKGTEHTGWDLCPIIYNTRKHNWSSSSLRDKIAKAEFEHNQPQDIDNVCSFNMNPKTPINLVECFNYLDTIPDVSEWLKLDEDDAIGVSHQGLGQAIRNDWGLWKGSDLKTYLETLGLTHPDDMSSVILRSYYRIKNGKLMLLKEQIEYFKKFWETKEEDMPKYMLHEINNTK